MAAIIQTQGKDRISRLQNRLVRREIRLRTTVRLYIDVVVGVEYLSPHITAIFLELIYKLCSAIVTARITGGTHVRIALRVFPRETTAARRENRL